MAIESCHPDLQRVAWKVLEIMDHTVLEGYRPEEIQKEHYRTGKSKVEYPNSKHNRYPSDAMDLAPYPIDWNDMPRFYFFAGVVIGVAETLGVHLRWGGDWDRDRDLKDQTFYDLVHFERVE